MHNEDSQAGNSRSGRGWYDRGYLPHFDGGEIVQFVTYRLAGSLPRVMVDKIKFLRDTGKISDLDYHREIESLLDRGFGPTHLLNPVIAEIVVENLLKFDGIKYVLLHWVIMSNHVHLLLRPVENNTLSSIMHSIKSYTANRANKMLGLAGSFWSIEYFDRYIRNYDHFVRTVDYIHRNPVKAGLCERSADWSFSCARHHE
ncbi:MAG: transposase [Pyrinomonadaceae bacterium]